MQPLFVTLAVGVGATLIMDLWGLARQPLFGIAPPNYALVGRWLAHMPAGRFRHVAIADSAPRPGERVIGWVAHYLIGVAFAGLLTAIGGPAWINRPTPGLALAVGLITVLAPFLLMQPAMGAGIAASRTANPAAARWQSLITHGVFGLGLYVAAVVVQLANSFYNT